MSAPTFDLVCPQGHGPQPQLGNFCYFCGTRMVPKPPATPPSMKGDPAAVVPATPVLAVNQPVPPPYAPPIPVGPTPVFCNFCGMDGAALDAALNVCPECDWLRPLVPGYRLDPSAFQWAADGFAMEKLRKIKPLSAAARAVSDKVGRPWIEGLFNAVRISERQLPGVYHQAVLAAQILALPQMPDVYVSGERMWEAATYGSDKSAFVVLGTALVTSFQGDDLLFLLAREMGHVAAHHALWKTVIRFLIGEQRAGGGLMGGGVLSLLDITKLVEGAVELPLLAWARQSEITADRAGMVAIRDEHVARRVLLTWCLKSALLFKQVNVAEWMKQQEDVEDQVSRLSEIAMSPTPYIARRLRLLAEFARGPQIESVRKNRGALIDSAKSKIPPAPPISQPGPRPPVKSPAALSSEKEEASDDSLRLTCAACGTALRVPRSVLQNKEVLNVRCANPQCKNVLTLKRSSRASLGAQASLPAASSIQSTPEQSGPLQLAARRELAGRMPALPQGANLHLKCAACGAGMRVPRSTMTGKETVNVRCPNPECGKTMILKIKPKEVQGESSPNTSLQGSFTNEEVRRVTPAPKSKRTKPKSKNKGMR